MPAFSKLEKLRLVAPALQGTPHIDQHFFDINPCLVVVEVIFFSVASRGKFHRRTIPGVVEYSVVEFDRNDDSHLNEWTRYSDDEYETQV